LRMQDRASSLQWIGCGCLCSTLGPALQLCQGFLRVLSASDARSSLKVRFTASVEQPRDQGSFTNRFVGEWTYLLGLAAGRCRGADALYYHKQALRFGDFEAAEKYLRQYAELGGTRKGLKASIRLAEPTARVPKKLRRQFMFSLSPSERQTLQAAQRWYRTVYQSRGLRKAG
jgi:hypothetical protein